MYNFGMSTLTISEARASLPEMVTRAADGEEIIITRHGRPAAIMVRPDIVWSRPAIDVIVADARELAAALAERARSHGRTLDEELRAIAAAAGQPVPRTVPPVHLTMVSVGGGSSWSRSEIYDDESR